MKWFTKQNEEMFPHSQKAHYLKNTQKRLQQIPNQISTSALFKLQHSALENDATSEENSITVCSHSHQIHCPGFQSIRDQDV